MYFDDDQELNITQLQRTKDKEIKKIVDKGKRDYNHIFMAVCTMAAFSVGTLFARDGLTPYQQAGLAIPVITALSEVSKTMKAKNTPVLDEEAEELEIVSVSTTNNKVTNNLVNFGKKAWQYTKVAAGAASLGIVGNLLYNSNLKDFTLLQMNGICASLAIASSMIVSNNPFKINIAGCERTLTKGIKK